MTLETLSFIACRTREGRRKRDRSKGAILKSAAYAKKKIYE